MSIVAERKQQADRDRLDAEIANLLRDPRCGGRIERADDGAVGADALGDLERLARPRERILPAEEEIEDRVAVASRLLAHLVDTAEALGDEESGTCALAFEERVRADRGPVREEGHRAGGGDLTQPSDDRLGRVARRRWDLGDVDASGFLIDRDEVGERATGVRRDAEGHAGV